MGLFRSFRFALPAFLVAVLAACGGSSGDKPVGVTASEYAFQGLPSELKAGGTSFSIRNEGREVHELQLFKLAEDVAKVSELLGKSQDEVLDKMTSVGMVSANPGDEESFEAELSAGRYAAVCLVPVGTLPGKGRSVGDMEEMEDMVFDPNADNHMRRGMFAELTVT